VLYKLFNRYYQAENVFYNELHIINKRRHEEDNDDGEKWMKVGQEKREALPITKKYNFLEDFKRTTPHIAVIERANNWESRDIKDTSEKRYKSKKKKDDQSEKTKRGKYREKVTSAQNLEHTQDDSRNQEKSDKVNGKHHNSYKESRSQYEEIT
jgi:hypothetical protein